MRIAVATKIERAIAEWKLRETTTVLLTLHGCDGGRKSLRTWDQDRWFVDVPETVCRKAGAATGDRVRLELDIACEDLPVELADLLAADAGARRRGQVAADNAGRWPPPAGAKGACRSLTVAAPWDFAPRLRSCEKLPGAIGACRSLTRAARLGQSDGAGPRLPAGARGFGFGALSRRAHR